ncbi:HSP70/90 co-chaperone, partial [Cryomyces antarcticus]
MDCASALRINSSNVKAWYRSASACLALDKIPEAEDSCARGLEVDPDNAALRLLHNKVGKRKEHVESLERERRKREERKRAEERALKVALKGRNILTRQSGQPPEMEDATIKLSDPLDASSTLSFPAILLYPLQLQSDFIKAFQETESVGQHLTYIFPLP